ncbi:MAG: pyrroline-5-carboxylate reductase [Chitinophagaceae bacterium]|nr:MAG: pyrroline-5-carboxylate reductase [Chitinophagaceae bacterium]
MGKKIAIIGGGNLGSAIAEGLVDTGFSEAADIVITKRNVSTLGRLQQKGVRTGSDNNDAVKSADVVILAVKPFQVAEVLAGIKNELVPGKLLISVVTGVLISEMDSILQSPVACVRAMPNTAIAIGESMTCVCSRNASASELEYVNDLFGKLGKVVTIDEKLMEAATVLAACGTAYAMRFIRANIQGGIEIGFDAATASLIAAQTVKGAADLLLRKGTHPEQEIDKVTTPKGCTIAGLNEMEHQGFSSSLIRGVVTSYKKIARD